jgi:LacI family transcriptional regulator
MARRTIIEIAERVGVSTATVSRALNNVPGVSEEKRRQILAVARELDYYPNAIARSLQGQRTNTVCYTVDVSTRAAADLFFFKDFITALADRCVHYGLDLLLHPVSHGDVLMHDLGRVLRSGRADGLIVSDIRLDDERIEHLKNLKAPFVAFGRNEQLRDLPYVDVDGELGIYYATRHLIERGHRRIALLGLPVGFSCALQRRDGYLRALREYGVPLEPDLLVMDLANEREAAHAAERLLALPQAPTAFVSSSDMLAIQTMSVATRRGLRAGRDYAITGFDDLPLAEHTSPPLTTVRQPLDRIADALIMLLLRVLDEESGPRQVLIEPELVVRESS